MDLAKRLRRLGWAMFAAMWIPFGATFIGMIGMPSGEYTWAELPTLTRVSLVLGGVLAGASTLLLVGAPIVSGLSGRSLLRSGEPATGKVLSLTDTGTTINNNPVVRLVLEVQPVDGSSFQAETEKLISRLDIPNLQPGAVLQVRYDPLTREVAIEG
jgi:hypothetical protein